MNLISLISFLSHNKHSTMSSLEVICNWFLRLFCCYFPLVDFEEEKNNYSSNYLRNRSNNNNSLLFSSEKVQAQQQSKTMQLPQNSFNFNLLHPQYYPSRCLWSGRRRCFSESLSDLTGTYTYIFYIIRY